MILKNQHQWVSFSLLQNERSNDHTNQHGYIMLIMLLFVAVFAGIISGVVIDRNQNENSQLANATGVHVAEIARAARIFVRDNSLVAPTALVAGSAFHKNRIAPAGTVADIGDGTPSTGPVDVTVANLIGAGLLPTGFGMIDGAGNEITPMGHQIRIIAGNVAVDGNPADSDVVASAYVYLVAGADIAPESTNDVIIGLRNSGVAVSAPRFDALGVNQIAANCRGASPVAFWDTGCLTPAEFTTLTGDAAFVPGSLIVPAWRAAQFDLRALMRFPQPENPGYATMLTGLAMAEQDWDKDAVTDELIWRDASDAIVDATDPDARLRCMSPNITVADDTGAPVDTGICSFTNDDNTTGTDNRFDIRQINNLSAGGIIASPQTRFHTASGTDVDTDVITRYDGAAYQINSSVVDGTGALTTSVDPFSDSILQESLLVNAPMTIREGNMRVYDTVDLPAGYTKERTALAGTTTTGRSINVATDAASMLTSTNIGTISAGSVRTELFNNDIPAGSTFSPTTMSQNTINMERTFTVTGEATIDEATIISSSVNVLGETDLSELRNTGDITINPSATPLTAAEGYRAVIGSLEGNGALNITGDMTLSSSDSNNSATFMGNTDLNGSLNVTNSTGDAQCFGDCPDRCATPSSIILGGTICP